MKYFKITFSSQEFLEGDLEVLFENETVQITFMSPDKDKVEQIEKFCLEQRTLYLEMQSAHDYENQAFYATFHKLQAHEQGVFDIIFVVS